MANQKSSTNIVSKEAIDHAVKSLISLALSAREADLVVRRFKPEFRGEETVDVLRMKYEYVKGLFRPDADLRDACTPDGATERDILATDYYSLLSVLILEKWG